MSTSITITTDVLITPAANLQTVEVGVAGNTLNFLLNGEPQCAQSSNIILNFIPYFANTSLSACSLVNSNLYPDQNPSNLVSKCVSNCPYSGPINLYTLNIAPSLVYASINSCSNCDTLVTAGSIGDTDVDFIINVTVDASNVNPMAGGSIGFMGIPSGYGTVTYSLTYTNAYGNTVDIINSSNNSVYNSGKFIWTYPNTIPINIESVALFLPVAVTGQNYTASLKSSSSDDTSTMGATGYICNEKSCSISNGNSSDPTSLRSKTNYNFTYSSDYGNFFCPFDSTATTNSEYGGYYQSDQLTLSYLNLDSQVQGSILTACSSYSWANYSNYLVYTWFLCGTNYNPTATNIGQYGGLEFYTLLCGSNSSSRGGVGNTANCNTICLADCNQINNNTSDNVPNIFTNEPM